jgi:hypothetical protein
VSASPRTAREKIGRWLYLNTAPPPRHLGESRAWLASSVMAAADDVLGIIGAETAAPVRRSVEVYRDPDDWWVGYYRGDTHHYVCPLPTIVIRWPRRSATVLDEGWGWPPTPPARSWLVPPDVPDA